MMNKFVINKLGVVDFWYYDFQEFDLSDGRLLLRGSNGSGKSVTMQSFIPLVLDGDKTARRLDPSGSSDKRLEDYMVDETRNERTSYLYIEFKNNDTFATIGMGIKAEKNKKMDLWYFILNDGRRVNKDLFLYEGVTEKIALTKTKLQNRLSSSGFYTISKDEYKRKVNELIFGYNDIEDYEDLLNLLIKVRAPKVSKDFKPAVLYDILKDSLNVLNEDDLRVLSESMQNMDDLRRRQLLLKESIKAARNIQLKYDAYNKKILFDKAKSLKFALSELNTITDAKIDQKNEYITKEEICADITKEKREKEMQLESAQVKLKDYATSELAIVISEAENLKKQIHITENNLIGINKSIDEQDRKLKKFLHRKDDISKKIEFAEYELDKRIIEAEEFAVQSAFPHWNNVNARKLISMRENDELSFYSDTMADYEEQLTICVSALEEKESSKSHLEDLENKEIASQNELKIVENNIRLMSELLEDSRSDFKIAFDNWSTANKLFKLSEKNRLYLFEKINTIEIAVELNHINEYLYDVFKLLDYPLRNELLNTQQSEKLIKQKIDGLKKELHQLESMPELEPPCSKSAIKLRSELNKRKIPFIQFYKAFDFAEELDDSTRNLLESAFCEMGLLDALITDYKYRDTIFDIMDKTQCSDKFIFCDSDDFVGSLKLYLKPESNDAININMLKSIIYKLISDESMSFVESYGYYRHGIVTGKADKDYSSKYIGEVSRRNFRKAKILELQELLSRAEEEYKDVTMKISEIEDSMNLLKVEYDNAPTYIHVKEALNEVDKLFSQKELLLKESGMLQEDIFQAKHDYESNKVKVNHLCKDIALEKKAPVYREALSFVNKLKWLFQEIKETIISLLHEKEFLSNVLESIENTEQILDDIRYRLASTEQELQEQKNILKTKESFIKESKNNDITKEIEWATRIVSSFPDRINELRDKISTITAEMKALIKNIEELEIKQKQKEEITDRIRKCFVAEANYNFVLPFQDVDADKFCENIVVTYKSDCRLDTSNYYGQLINALHSNETSLRESTVQLSSETINYEDIGFSVRNLLYCNIDGKQVPFVNLHSVLNDEFNEIESMIKQSERNIFENILFTSISGKISAKITQSRSWVNKINTIMKAKGKAQRLELVLKWEPKKAENEEEMPINKLIDVLGDNKKVSSETIQKLAKHFNSKIKSKIREVEDKQEHPNYQIIIRDVLDYRQWFEFQLFFSKDNETKKELTLRAFNQFSVGERAMAMYIPMFAAVNARYDKASKKCARIVCMDEAFAGISDNNKRILFKLLKDMELEYIINSQELWGTYAEVDSLNIYELYREPSDRFVGITKYHWDGVKKTYVE